METYDHIVIGARSSGCVIASRLTEDSSVSVLRVEASGNMDDFWVNTPAGVSQLFGNAQFNWRFKTEPAPTLGAGRCNGIEAKA